MALQIGSYVDPVCPPPEAGWEEPLSTDIVQPDWRLQYNPMLLGWTAGRPPLTEHVGRCYADVCKSFSAEGAWRYVRLAPNPYREAYRDQRHGWRSDRDPT